MQWSSMPAVTSESLRRRLDAYAIVASTAGIGLLAPAPAAEGRIRFTPAYHRITINTNFNLDLNHDGIVDFVFHNLDHFSSDSGHSSLYAVAPGCRVTDGKAFCPNALQLYNGDFPWGAAALPRGAKIGATSTLFFGAEMVFETAADGEAGYWAGATNRYLGMRFLDAEGATHYGWARFTVRGAWTSKMVAVLTGYAYETVPDKPIVAGKMFDEEDPSNGPDASEHDAPGTGASVVDPVPGVSRSAPLGALALGYQGLSMWRRNDDSASQMPHSN